MELLTPDYIALAIALGGAIAGLFIGFSGALAFLVGSTTVAALTNVVWPTLTESIPNLGLRVLVLAIGALLVFGVVRLIVKKLVHGLVAQPGDAIFGAITASIAAFLCALGILWALRSLTDNPVFDSAILKSLTAQIKTAHV